MQLPEKAFTYKFIKKINFSNVIFGILLLVVYLFFKANSLRLLSFGFILDDRLNLPVLAPPRNYFFIIQYYYIMQ